MKKLIIGVLGILACMSVGSISAYAGRYTDNLTYAYMEDSTGNLILNEGGLQAEIDLSAAGIQKVYGVAVGNADNSTDGSDELIVCGTRDPNVTEILALKVSVDDFGVGTLTSSKRIKFFGKDDQPEDIGIGNVDNSADGSQEIVVAIKYWNGDNDLLCLRWNGAEDEGVVVAQLPSWMNPSQWEFRGVGVGNADNSVDGSEEIIVSTVPDLWGVNLCRLSRSVTMWVQMRLGTWVV